MTAATTVRPLLTALTGREPPVTIALWDGSVIDGPPDAPTVTVSHRRALRRLLWERDELGLVDAYVAGELDTDDDPHQVLALLRQHLADSRVRGGHQPHPLGRVRRLRAAAVLGVLGPRPRPPLPRAPGRGVLHSRSRDRAAISYHYDLSNDFYRLLLGPTMAYSCAYWVPGRTSLDDAQRAKFDLVCRKLALEPGSRLLDVGCGWGSLALHAARHCGAHVTAVTLSRQQQAYALEEVERWGLADRVHVLLQDYRDIPEQPYDAVSCIEMGEHVGDATYPAFAAKLARLLKPGGRLLLQQMSRGLTAPGGGRFIETYIAPDMHMRPLTETVALLEAADLDVRSTEPLGEHYVRTVDAWHTTLTEQQRHFDALVGPAAVRLWKLYLAGGSLAFADRRMGVDQILATRAESARSRTSGCAIDAEAGAGT